MTNDMELTIKISADNIGVIRILFDILDSIGSELTEDGFEAFIERLIVRGANTLLESGIGGYDENR